MRAAPSQASPHLKNALISVEKTEPFKLFVDHLRDASEAHRGSWLLALCAHLPTVACRIFFQADVLVTEYIGQRVAAAARRVRKWLR